MKVKKINLFIIIFALITNIMGGHLQNKLKKLNNIECFSYIADEISKGSLNNQGYLNEFNSLRLVIDSKNSDKLPDNFRKSSDSIGILQNKDLNLKGLDTLNESGSAQFSENGMYLLKKSIDDKFNIYIVDLREESHGFINGIAVSWKDAENKANKGLTKEQVIFDENEKLNSISIGNPITIYNNNEHLIIPEKVQNEKQLVESSNMSYIRIPVTDNERPTDDKVDYFVDFIKNLKPNSWLHFHCKRGLGRTTTFMVMYDIMKNSKNVSLEDIMKRQILLGGQNLIVEENNKFNYKNYSQERWNFLKNFYNYSRENNDNFKTSWSSWIKSKEYEKTA